MLCVRAKEVFKDSLSRWAHIAKEKGHQTRMTFPPSRINGRFKRSFWIRHVTIIEKEWDKASLSR